MDALLLSRLQFALTIGFHFLFPPITIGLAWLLVFFEYRGWKRDDADFRRISKFFAKLLALTFAIGVATGIVMEFQFGTNWSEYSKFVGDVFGAPLAAEGVFAFFLESGFLGLYLFGRGRVGKGVHWFAILMVAVGSTISAFWILVANSWQQTPTGYIIANGRAELVDFWAAVFNPSTMIRFYHTLVAALISGAFFVAGISAYLVLKGKGDNAAKKALKGAVLFGFVSSILALMPTGHEHAKQVAITQPEKFAAIEGLYTTQTSAPMMIFAYPTDHPPELKAPIEIPGLLSWMVFGDFDAEIMGIDQVPVEDRPPLWLTFVSFHNMVILGMYFIFILGLSTWYIWKKKFFEKTKLLKILVWSIPLPLAACQLGWITAEVGRQPWVVYKVLRTADAYSFTVSAGEILFSIIMFGLIYIFLGSLYIYILVKKVKHGPEPALEGNA